MAEKEGAEVVVVHAASIAVTVRNGPSRVAFAMNDSTTSEPLAEFSPEGQPRVLSSFVA